jgi:predicted restriction endonuclease
MINNNCEICGKNRLLETHHIRSKCFNGTDKPYNLCYLCSNCHKLVHCGLIIIEGRFDCTSGNIVVWRKLNEKSVTGFEDPEVYLIPNTKYLRDNYIKKHI